MKKKILHCFTQGIATGSLILNVVLCIISIWGPQNTLAEITASYPKHLLAGVFVALVFSLLSLVYELESMSIPLKACLHMVPALIIYFITAWYMNWLPVEFGPGLLIACCLAMTIAALLIWAGFYLYYYKEAADINRQLRK